jgi:hypothetical protein
MHSRPMQRRRLARRARASERPVPRAQHVWHTRTRICAIVLLAGACAERADAPSDQDGRRSSAPLLPFVGAPAEGPSTSGELPLLANGAPNIDTGYMTTWPELSGGPVALDDNWLRDAVGDGFTTPRVFESQLRSAVSVAKETVERESAATSGVIAEISNWIPKASVSATDRHHFGYTPERARWMTEVAADTVVAAFEDPAAYAELRQRGARLYCAAKTAASKQSDATRIMGRSSVANLNILGAKLRLLSVEPTLSLQNPMRFDTGKEDGAQAFVTPFTAGVRITPISFLPSLPEVRVPVVAISADSEVTSRVNVRSNGHTKWLTMSHVDGFASAAQSLRATTGSFVLFPIGPIAVMGELSIDLGFASCSQASVYDSCRTNPIQQVGRQLSGVKQGANGALQPMPTPARAGGWTTPDFSGVGAYTDAPWIVDTESWWSKTVQGDAWVPTVLPDPLTARMLQNNDKSLELMSDATVRFRLSAGANYEPFKWLSIGATIGGTIGAGATIVHRFREQEELQRLEDWQDPQLEFPTARYQMVTTFTVTPGMEGHFDFGTNAEVHIELKEIPIIGTLRRSFEIWKLSKSVRAGERKLWPEHNRLRMDNAISDGITPSFAAFSHWPGGAPFGSYDAFESCVPPDTRREEPPARCGATPPSGDFDTQVGIPLCFYTPAWEFPPDWQGGPEGECHLALQPFLESGVRKQQTFHGQTVDARQIDKNDFEGDFTAIKRAIDVCVSAFAAAGRTQEGIDRIQFAACDRTATLVDQVMDGELEAGAPLPGAEGAPGPCH